MLDLQQTVAHLVLDHPECASTLARHRIDYCCGGDTSLASALADGGLDAGAVVTELERAITDRREPSGVDPSALSTDALLAYIVEKHHAYLRDALPFVRALAAKVGRVHGGHNPKLTELDEIVTELDAALVPHLEAEEQTLFPALLAAEVDRTFVARELAAMREEHLAVGRLLSRMRSATEDYRLPEWACNSYRTLFAELARLEADVLTHVHLENHVVSPRFAAA